MESSKIEKKIQEINDKVSQGNMTKVKADFLISELKKKLNSKIVEK